MAAAEPPKRLSGRKRLALGALFAGLLAFEVLMPLTGLVARWHDGDIDGGYRYSWHMYSTLDKYRGH